LRGPVLEPFLAIPWSLKLPCDNLKIQRLAQCANLPGNPPSLQVRASRLHHQRPFEIGGPKDTVFPHLATAYVGEPVEAQIIRGRIDFGQ